MHTYTHEQLPIATPSPRHVQNPGGASRTLQSPGAEWRALIPLARASVHFRAHHLGTKPRALLHPNHIHTYTHTHTCSAPAQGPPDPRFAPGVGEQLLHDLDDLGHPLGQQLWGGHPQRRWA